MTRAVAFCADPMLVTIVPNNIKARRQLFVNAMYA